MKEKLTHRIYFFLMVLFMLFASSFFLKTERVHAQTTSSIMLTVTNLRNNEGFSSALLFKTKDGYPDSVTKAYRMARGKIVLGKSELIFNDVPDGSYVISCIHDENGNEKFDKNFFGIPKEGSGFSNNTEMKSGMPSFEQGLFNHKGQTRITIKMQYF